MNQKKDEEKVVIQEPGRKQRQKVIDPEHGKLVTRCFAKNNCRDIFLEAEVEDGVRMFQEKSVVQRIKFKFKITQKRDQYMKLRFMILLNAVKGELYLQVLLRSMKLVKEIFILEVEEGTEVFIPRQLS